MEEPTIRRRRQPGARGVRHTGCIVCRRREAVARTAGGRDASPAQTTASHPKSLRSQLRYKRLEDGIFRWPKIEDGVMRLSAAQLSTLLEMLDWRRADAAGSTRPAERVGLGKRKGPLAIDHDADLVVLDPGCSHSVRNADQFSKARYTLFDGMNVPFLIEAVVLRGNTVFSDGHVHETRVGVVL
jgi:hypothetical protein